MFYVPIEMTKEYVRENEIYAAEDGEIIRITPDMIKKVIRDGVMTEVYFTEVESEEVYKEYMRSVWREEKALQRRNRCWVSNGKGTLVRCDGNCANCEHRNDNTTLSHCLERLHKCTALFNCKLAAQNCHKHIYSLLCKHIRFVFYI